VNGSFATVAPEKLASQELDASTAASGPHGLMSTDFSARGKTQKASPNEGFL
jgi:hypothetical protein